MKIKTATKNILTGLSLAILLSACSTSTATQAPLSKKPTVDAKKDEKPIVEKKEIIVEKKVIETKIVYVTKYDKLVIGQVENAYIPAIDATLKARIDTGATTTSINALNIKGFERDGKKWVRFDLIDSKGKSFTKKYPVSRMVNIKRHGAKDQSRFVIKLRVNISSSSQLIDVSLTDRSKFIYPVLIGRNFLNGVALVDVAKKYTKKPIKKENK